MLKQLRLAIKGEVVLTDELASAIDRIADSKAPQTWVSDSDTSSRSSFTYA